MKSLGTNSLVQQLRAAQPETDALSILPPSIEFLAYRATGPLLEVRTGNIVGLYRGSVRTKVSIVILLVSCHYSRPTMLHGNDMNQTLADIAQIYPQSFTL